jgi:hypothetical protein
VRVRASEGVRRGSVLNLEGRGQDRTLLLDIGTEDGLSRGDWVSVGGVGEGHTLWQVVEVHEIYSRARRLSQSPASLPRPGESVIAVRRVK